MLLNIEKMFYTGGIKMESDEVIKTLRKCELFSELSDKELRSFAKLGSVQEYEAGDTIFEQGSLATKLHVLSEGQVSLLRKLDLGNTRMAYATVYVLRERAHRRLMGGWCTLVGKQHVHMCSAKCDKRTKMVSIDCSDLRAIITEKLKIRVKILEKLVLILRDRIESSYEVMETL
jgi:CRP-like cAMP-binding protein